MAYTTYWGDWHSMGNRTKGRQGIKVEVVTNNDTTKTYHFVPICQVSTTKPSGNSFISSYYYMDCDFHMWDTNHVHDVTSNLTNIKVDDGVTKTTTESGNVRTWSYTKGHSAATKHIWINFPEITSANKSVQLNIPVKTSYKITYNTNGGSTAPTAGTKWYNENFTITSATPTKTGYNFKNKWNTNSAGTGTNYNSGTTYSTTNLSNASRTLYAVWEEKTYTVIYNPNTPSGQTISNIPANQTKYYTKNLTLSLTAPTCSNYIFMGWNTAANGSGTMYQPGGTYNTNANVTLYAIWKNVFDISYLFHLNTGDERETYMVNYPTTTSWTYLQALSFLTDYPIKYYINKNGYYYSKYKLNKWQDQSTKATYTSSSTMPGKNTIIEAVWDESTNVANLKTTAIRGSLENNSLKPNDTGEGCILKIQCVRPTYYKYHVTNSTIGAPTLTNNPIDIEIQIDDRSGADPTVFNVTDSSTDTTLTYDIYAGGTLDYQFDLDTQYNITTILTSTITKETGTGLDEIDLTSEQNISIDFLSRAIFTIDISADGDRIGIFQPIEDYDENNPTDYPKSEIELTGAMYTTPTSTINLGSCFVPSALTNTGGKLYFSIPTGRVFNKNLRVASLSFGIVTRQSNSNGGNGTYITSHPEASNNTDATYRPWSPAPFNYVYGTPPTGSFAFKNAELVYKTVNYSDIKVSIEGNTNIRVLINDTNTTQVFSGSLHTYLNNQPGVIELSNIQLTLAAI